MLFIAALVALMMLAAPAAGHEWYDPACCNEVHCHPVADGVVQQLGFGVSVRLDTHTLTIPYSDPRLRWSRDDHDHICSNGSQVYCVYRKPSLF